MVNQHGDMWGSPFCHIQQQTRDFPLEEDTTIDNKTWELLKQMRHEVNSSPELSGASFSAVQQVPKGLLHSETHHNTEYLSDRTEA